jgi:hypothetical protein
MTASTQSALDKHRAALVEKIGDCCRGADPLCNGGCLVAEAAIKQRDHAPAYVAAAVELFTEGRRQGEVEGIRQMNQVRQDARALAIDECVQKLHALGFSYTSLEIRALKGLCGKAATT